MTLDRFTRNYLIILSTVAVFAAAWFLLNRDPRVSEINERLAADPALADYPYRFRVFSLEAGVATLGSPRSAQVPVMRFLRTAFPELSRTAVDDPAMMAAQDVLVEKHARAEALVLAEADVTRIRWQLDERWFNEHAVFLHLDD